VGDNANLLVGSQGGGADGTGLIWFAPLGSTLPTNATSALDAAFLNAGLISEDGITMSFSEDSTEIRAYGTQASQRTVITGQTYTAQMQFLETNEVTTAVFHRKALGSISPAASTGAFSLTDGTFERRTYVCVAEVLDGNNKMRIVFPSCEVTNRGDFQISSGSAITREVTLTAYPVSGVAIQYYFAVPNLG
jgi:hypothetical protein